MTWQRTLVLAVLLGACSTAPQGNGDDAGNEGGGGGEGGAAGEAASEQPKGGKGGSSAKGGSGGSSAKGGSGGKAGGSGGSKGGEGGSSGGTGGGSGGSAGGGGGMPGTGGQMMMTGGAGGMATFPPLQAPVPPKEGLVLHFTFDEGMGTEVKDQSGNANHGTFVKGAPIDAPAHPAAPWTDGLWGKAIYPNKGKIVDEWVRVPSSDSINTTGDNNAITVAAWVKLEFYGQQWNMLVHRHVAMMSSERFAIGVNEGVTLGYIQHGSAVGASPVFPNKWMHIAMTYDGATVQLYENGAGVGERITDLGVQKGTEPVTIAAGINMRPEGELASEVVHGIVDEVVIYNRALSPDEVKKLAGL